MGIWGDCLHSHTALHECSAEQKHGIWGWAADTGLDILLALLLEFLYSLNKPLATSVADSMNFEFESDRLLCQTLVERWLRTGQTLGYVGTLAFFFVPQWEELPEGAGLRHDEVLLVDCSDLAFGEKDFRCFQRRLDVYTRRLLLQKFLNGPLVFAPFVGIMKNTILPGLLTRLDSIANKTDGPALLIRLFCAIPRCIIRILAVVLVYDGDLPGCLLGSGTVKWYSGNPFQVDEDNPERDKLNAALKQIVLKPFKVEQELIEIEMSFVWMTLFVPLKPVGVVATLIAKIVECHSDMAKLLKTRRRPTPESDFNLRGEMNTFLLCIAVVNIGWSAGLSLITYNDDLFKYSARDCQLLMGGVFCWMILSYGLVAFGVRRKCCRLEA